MLRYMYELAKKSLCANANDHMSGYVCMSARFAFGFAKFVLTLALLAKRKMKQFL